MRWLEDFLRHDPLTSLTCVVFVTHDRVFAENVANSVVELDRGRLYEHRNQSSSDGSLIEAYLNGKAKRLADDASATVAARSRLRKELAWLRRGAKARQTKSVARLERLEALRGAASRDNAPRKALFEQTAPPMLAAETKLMPIATLEDLKIDGIFEAFDLELGPTDRVGVVGANGCGKSSLVEAVVQHATSTEQLCAGAPNRRSQAQATGSVQLAASARVGYYSQQCDLSTDGDRTPLEFAKRVLTRQNDSDIREDLLVAASSLLQTYAFDSDDLKHAPINRLSGGERRRLQLMSLLEPRPNLLVLDEVSNDLDLDALQALERFLVNDFKGALLLVSHDRALLDATCTKLLVLLGDGFVHEFNGSMSDYLHLLDHFGGAPTRAQKRDNDSEHDLDQKARRKRNDARRRRRLNAPRLIDKLAKLIAEKEGELADLDNQMATVATDFSALAPLYEARLALQAMIDDMYREWAELETILAEPD